MKDLKETVNLMLSDRWEDRLVAEYWQTKIRYQKLHKMLVKMDAGVCKRDDNPYALRGQKENMGKYLYCLEIRAAKEGIDLDV